MWEKLTCLSVWGWVVRHYAEDQGEGLRFLTKKGREALTLTVSQVSSGSRLSIGGCISFSWYFL